MVYSQILGNFMPIFLIFALSKINYARTFLIFSGCFLGILKAVSPAAGDNMFLAHRSIIGTRLDATSYQDACDRIQSWAENNLSCYIVAANVHVVMIV